MMVGHIVSITEKPSKTLRANSVCELSFPVTAGFSGAAVISSDQVDKFQLIGMLYSNLESSIQVHSFIDYKNEIEREKEKETIVKVTEFGLMHSIYDIKQFLDDMGIKDIFV
jgi:hypothetical protein